MVKASNRSVEASQPGNARRDFATGETGYIKPGSGMGAAATKRVSHLNPVVAKLRITLLLNVPSSSVSEWRLFPEIILQGKIPSFDPVPSSRLVTKAKHYLRKDS
jgi:hypothetical protein